MLNSFVRWDLGSKRVILGLPPWAKLLLFLPKKVHRFDNSELHLDFRHVAHAFVENYFHCCHEVTVDLDIRRECNSGKCQSREPASGSRAALPRALKCTHMTVQSAWGKEEKLPPFASKVAFTPLNYFSPAFVHVQEINYLSLPKERNMKGNQTFKDYKYLYSLFSEIISQFHREQSWLSIMLRHILHYYFCFLSGIFCKAQYSWLKARINSW